MYIYRIQMSKVLDYLYISGEKHAHDMQWLNKRNITYIINCAEEVESRYPHHLLYLNLDMDDHPNEDISKHFQASYEFIEDASRKGKSVLVHCMMGISRSATIVLYYLMRKFNMTYDEALKYLTVKRKIVWPNKGFRQKLRAISAIHHEPRMNKKIIKVL
jgi:protein-tyrosine phosphatase